MSFYQVDRTGLDAWSLFTKRERGRSEAKAEAKDRPELREHEVVTPGHEVPLSTVSRASTVGKVAHMAAEYGWDTKLGMSEYRKADRWVKEQVVEGKIEKHFWVNAFSPDKKHYLSVSRDLFLLDGWPVPTVDEVRVHISELGIEP